MPVAGHHQAGQRRLGLMGVPGAFQGDGHGRRRLAGADHQGAAGRGLGQPVGQQGIGVHGRDGDLAEPLEPGARRLGALGEGLRGNGPRGRGIHSGVSLAKGPGDEPGGHRGRLATGQGAVKRRLRQTTTRRLPSGSSHLPILHRPAAPLDAAGRWHGITHCRSRGRPAFPGRGRCRRGPSRRRRGRRRPGTAAGRWRCRAAPGQGCARLPAPG